MSTYPFSWANFGLRLILAFLLVGLTYNPTGYSYLHLAVEHRDALPMSMLVLLGIVLLIGWVIFLRATLRSLGPIGLILSVGGFGALIWVLFDYGVIDLKNPGVVSWLGDVVVALILALGMSWSHVRRRMSGQVDADDVDEA